MSDDARLGHRIGRFALSKKLGSGAMGSVYQARDGASGRNVAVKFMHAHLATDPAAVERFRAEGRVAALVRDEHIAQVLDLGTTPEGYPYMVMELLEGVQLSDRVGRPMGAAAVVRILKQLCAAMQVAHQHGVVHRDLKPDHVFLCPRGQETDFVKVLDFGIAKVISPASGARAPSRVIWGTPQYMAPEQCGSGPVDNRTDLYAIGVIAYELVTGRVPFDGRNLVEVMMRQRAERPVPPHELEPSVPPALSDVIMRALAKRPEDRFATAAEMAEALTRVRTPNGQVPELRAEVRAAGERALMETRCTQLLSAGCYLATNDALPAMGEALCVVLHCDGVSLPLPCEVSMHVGAPQAAAWGTPRGFAVRFHALEPKVQALLDRLLRGDPLPRSTIDSELARLGREHRRNGVDDFYALLAVPSGADFAAVRRRVRECRARLEDALLCVNEPSARVSLQRAVERVDAAARVLCVPLERVAYDAHRGNFRGIAVCLEAGVSTTQLRAQRERCPTVNPNASAAVTAHLVASARHEVSGRLAEALAECELALTIDPLEPALYARREALMTAIEVAAGMTRTGDQPLYRHVMGGVPASPAKTPPSARSDAQLLVPDAAPAIG